MNGIGLASVLTDVYTALGNAVLIFFLIGIVIIVFAVIIWWKIFAKAGYSGAMGLLMFVPIANLIVLLILAFGQWPIHKELNYLRQQVGRNPQFLGQPPQFPSAPQPQYPSMPQSQYPGQFPQYPPAPNQQSSSSPQYPNYWQSQG